MCLNDGKSGAETENNNDNDNLTFNSNGASRKRVAIIGGGVSGILAIKSCKEEGCFDEIICYEKTSSMGGLWKYREISPDEHENVSTVMFSTIANSSKEMSAFSDFPPPESMPNYMHHVKMYKYIESYAKNFDCLRHIKYNHEIVRVERYKDTSKWNLNVRVYPSDQSQKDSIVEEIFDAVIVCIGHHSFPNIPKFEDQHKFNGKFVHTHNFKKPDDYYGKKVLVIGAGNSALDVAVELSSICDKVYLSTRRGCWILPRVGLRCGRPYDFSMLRRSLHDLKEYVPLHWVQIVIETILRKRFDHELYGLRPSHPLFTEHPTVNDAISAKILCGTVIIKGDICRFTESGVVFVGEENDTIHQIDCVVMATGYRLELPFLDKSLSDQILDPVENSMNLYKYIVPIELKKPTLGFIGLPNALGPLFPIAEMQCRWFVQLLAEKFSLPSIEQIKSDMEKYRNFRLTKFTNTLRHGTQVEWIPYLDELSHMFGAKPSLLKMLFKDPRLFFTCYFGPSVPYQYRLEGPHKWKDAKKTIYTVHKRVDAPLRTSRKCRIKEEIAILGSFADYNVLMRLFIGMFAVFFFEIFTNI